MVNSMRSRSLLPARVSDFKIDIFSNKSSLVLFWLLASHEQIEGVGFSINELGRVTGTSVGLVHKVVKQLEYEGLIIARGMRTGKRFYLKSPNKLLLSWVKEYSLIKKAKTKGFTSKSSKNIEWEKMKLVPALHTAASDLFKVKSTNLRTKEFYLKEWDSLPNVVEKLDLQELDRGYEFLLIKPYYSSLIEKVQMFDQTDVWMRSYNLLVVLDLCHFPLRGVEQAEAVFRKANFLKDICSWSEIENVLG